MRTDARSSTRIRNASSSISPARSPDHQHPRVRHRAILDVTPCRIAEHGQRVAKLLARAFDQEIKTPGPNATLPVSPSPSLIAALPSLQQRVDRHLDFADETERLAELAQAFGVEQLKHLPEL